MVRGVLEQASVTIPGYNQDRRDLQATCNIAQQAKAALERVRELNPELDEEWRGTARLVLHLDNLGLVGNQAAQRLNHEKRMRELSACSISSDEMLRSAKRALVRCTVAAGLPFAGHEVDRLPVLFVSLEDEPSIVRLRLRRIIESYRLDAGEVLPRMSLLDGTQAFSALMTEGNGVNAPPQFTQAFRELAEQAQGAGLIIVDNASDAFDANENSRRAVRAFVRGLAAIARKNNAAVVLLAHIDKAAARNGGQGNSYSGSTAWHNSARSRLALTEKDGAIVLEHEKANLSKLADPLRLTFTDGVLMPEAGTGGAMLTSEHFDQAEIVRALLAATEAGINVPASLTPGAHSAMKALEPLPEYGQTFKGKAGSGRAAALVKLRRDGRVREESYPGPHRKTKTRLVIVEGSAQNDDQGADGED